MIKFLLTLVFLLFFQTEADSASVSFTVAWTVSNYVVLNIEETSIQIVSTDDNFAVSPIPHIDYSCSSECYITEDLNKQTLLNTITLMVE